MTATENLAELALDVGIGEDGPFPAVVTLAPCMTDTLDPCPPSARHYPTWNGWLAEPRFDRATVDRIGAMLDRDRAAGFESDLLTWEDRCAVCGEGSTASGSMAGYVHRYGPLAHGEYLPAVILTRPTEPDWQGERIAPDADGRYAIGSYGWCWYEWDGSEGRDDLALDFGAFYILETGDTPL